MRSPARLVVLMLTIIGAQSTPIQDAADDLTAALGTFFDVKTNDVMGEVEDHVAELQNATDEHSHQLQVIEQEIDNLSHGLSIDCNGLLHTGNCFYLVNQRYSASRAELSCASDEAHLATFSTQEEMEAVHAYVIHSDLINDKSIILTWTNMRVNDSDAVVANSDNWLPGFPSSTTDLNVMWQIVSDDFLVYHDGLLNAPAEASAYPLCKKSVSAVATTTTTTLPTTTTTILSTTTTTPETTTNIICNAANGGYLRGGYKYDTTTRMSWDEGRSYCQSRGGDLAHHGIKSLDARREIRDALNLIYIAEVSFGLHFTSGEWQWLDGSTEEIHWSDGQPFGDGEAAVFYSYRDHTHDLKTISVSSTAQPAHPICEYAC